MFSSLISIEWVMAQSVVIEIPLEKLKELDRVLQEYVILKQMVTEKNNTIFELEKSLSLFQKELDIEKKENEINQKMLDIKDKEIAGINRNFDQMKEVADRAIKLAEISKPQSNWQVYGIAGLALFLAGILIGK